MGTLPLVNARILAASLSTHTTSLPLSAKQTPATRPTYPVPTTAILISLRHRCGPGAASQTLSYRLKDAGSRGLPAGPARAERCRRICARTRACLYGGAPGRRRDGVHELVGRPAGAGHGRRARRTRRRSPPAGVGAQLCLAPP